MVSFSSANLNDGATLMGICGRIHNLQLTFQIIVFRRIRMRLLYLMFSEDAVDVAVLSIRNLFLVIFKTPG